MNNRHHQVCSCSSCGYTYTEILHVVHQLESSSSEEGIAGCALCPLVRPTVSHRVKDVTSIVQPTHTYHLHCIRQAQYAQSIPNTVFFLLLLLLFFLLPKMALYFANLWWLPFTNTSSVSPNCRIDLILIGNTHSILIQLLTTVIILFVISSYWI